jgi:hypothetical protein
MEGKKQGNIPLTPAEEAEEAKKKIAQREIEEVRRQETAPQKRHLQRTDSQAQKEFERKAEKFLSLDFDDFTKLLTRDYKVPAESTEL